MAPEFSMYLPKPATPHVFPSPDAALWSPATPLATHNSPQNQGLATSLPESSIRSRTASPKHPVANKLHNLRADVLVIIAGTYVTFCFPTVCDREGWSSAGNGLGPFCSPQKQGSAILSESVCSFHPQRQM
jgi:hypothetical protein